MTQKDRSEMREMIHGILSGWQAATIAREDLTNSNLKEIKDHLKEINGNIKEHEKIINENLPHTILHCSRHDEIDKIKKALIINDTEKGIKLRHKKEKMEGYALWLTLAGVIVAIFLGVWNKRDNAMSKELNETAIYQNDTTIKKLEMINEQVMVNTHRIDSLKLVR